MGSKSTTVVQPPQPAPTPSATETAQDVLNAQLQTNPAAAQQSFELATNPNYGIAPFTQFLEGVRSDVFGGESAIRGQLLDNVLSNLQSPTGISPDQQLRVDAARDDARQNLSEALRNRANLGGNLYGGRSQAAEAGELANLENLFAQEDISRDERARLNAIQSALPALQILFPDVQLQQPAFTSPAPSSNALLGAVNATNQFNANAQNQAAITSANNAAQRQSSLFGALGTAFGGYGQGLCWVASEIFGGWYHPKTCRARFYISNYAPKWFRDLYMKHGEKFAEFISNKPLIKVILRPLFELMALRGGALCQTKS